VSLPENEEQIGKRLNFELPPKNPNRLWAAEKNG
jgi:hypothetical protein